ncbi:PREDICTED: uncharacterized protein LOC106820875 [Priapulus caudatus]|uniref:Uncharacterized protein LOC106820875 n=1 Tax=Priapulus caudatus TaxID=37621 RepID=A0ABM1F934_PRICU|nr:PREDICTED: uncharacterized protein LOC106820875 [Priapulus caudatus]
MGLVQKSELQDYWSVESIMKSTFAPAVMSRERFMGILWMLHVADNSTYVRKGDDGHDPLNKVRPVLEMLLQKFGDNMNPGREISLNEGTCGFKGRVSFRVYNLDKPSKWGIKLHELCEAESGCCFEFEVFTGMERQQSQEKTFDCVMNIMQRHLDKGHALFMDRYYSSPKLYDELYRRDTFYRDMPSK